MGRTFENRKAAMAKTSAHKTKVYSKYGRELYVCAKNGGADPNANLSLRRLIEKAKRDQVPSHVIDKALEKAQGAGGENYETVRFEGFGPGNCMVIVDCLTDNNNRTFGDVRQCFTKTDSKLGSQGAVIHMFDHRAIFTFPHDDEDQVLELLMEADVDVADIENEDGLITVYTPHTEFFKAKTALSENIPEIRFEMEEITFLPQSTVTLNEEDIAQFEKFVGLLNDCDDVQEIYHNVEFSA
jgi:YebC/PmpR family DNA-binding regulatory protein